MPKKGLEPPHPCGYMDLNHARLPIPPLRQVTALRGKPSQAACQEETTSSILQTTRKLSNSAQKSPGIPGFLLLFAVTGYWVYYPSSFALIVILAFRTLETGQPALAFSAALLKAAASALGTRAATSR